MRLPETFQSSWDSSRSSFFWWGVIGLVIGYFLPATSIGITVLLILLVAHFWLGEKSVLAAISMGLHAFSMMLGMAAGALFLPWFWGHAKHDPRVVGFLRHWV